MSNWLPSVRGTRLMGRGIHTTQDSSPGIVINAVINTPSTSTATITAQITDNTNTLTSATTTQVIDNVTVSK